MEKPKITIPETPGVYTFWQAKKPIYVGKAINLKNRLSSYFNLNLLPKTRRMVSEADKITFVRVNSEFEALLLEAKLIRQHQPKYNTISKDDKHPLYITITSDEFPRVITTRRGGTFGPFPSSANVRYVLKMLRRIFPFADHKVGKRACMYSQIGLCYPCPSTIKSKADKKVYLRNIRSIRSILDGRIISVKKALAKKMEDLSADQAFEEAALLRNKIQRLEYITKPRIPVDAYLENPNLFEDIRHNELKALKKILSEHKLKVSSLNRIECYDISHLTGLYATASMVVFTNGQEDKTEYRHFRVKQGKSQSDYDSIKEIARRRSKNDWPNPNLIIVDGSVGQVNSFASKFPVVGIAKNPDRLIIYKDKVRLSGPALSLIQRLRDEAHRFARRYHHRLISINLAHGNN
jgi:excinuclease ABC subunit C